MSFPVSDNPARRLHSILEEAKGLPKNLSCISVWSRVFSFNSDDLVRYYKSITHLNELADQIEFRMRQFDGVNHKLFLRELPLIRKIITPTATGDNWDSISQPLHTGALFHLEYCADFLSRSHTTIDLTKDQLASIKEQLTNAYKAVVESDLPPEVKTVVIDLLNAIHASLDYYKIQGIEGVKKAITYSLGLVKLHEVMLSSEKRSPSIRMVFELLGTVVALLKNSLQLKELIGGLDSFRLD